MLQHEPTPIVALNHAVALAEALGPQQGLRALEALKGDLQDYQPFHAARAQYLGDEGDYDQAREAYRRAIALASNPSDAAFLTNRMENLPG